jgi:hypothetical protein
MAEPAVSERVLEIPRVVSDERLDVTIVWIESVGIGLIAGLLERPINVAHK